MRKYLFKKKHSLMCPVKLCLRWMNVKRRNWRARETIWTTMRRVFLTQHKMTNTSQRTREVPWNVSNEEYSSLSICFLPSHPLLSIYGSAFIHKDNLCQKKNNSCLVCSFYCNLAFCFKMGVLFTVTIISSWRWFYDTWEGKTQEQLHNNSE